MRPEKTAWTISVALHEEEAHYLEVYSVAVL